uniref:Uncharacterized protein n=1 Tax=Ditylenchus dipsaci TaxID=166011 RepID=A0A915CXC3_9BILA
MESSPRKVTLAASLTTYFQSFIEDTQNEISLGVTVASLVSVIISLIEIFILALVTHVNEKKYNSRIFMQSSNSLSEAYQLSENIRTGKQLAPTFFFHFFNTVSLALGVTLGYCKVTLSPSLGELYTYIYYLTLAFSNLCIQITVIRYHPILNKRAALLFKSLKCHYCKRLRSNSQISILQKETRTHSAITTTVTGNKIMHEVTAEEHLQIMKKTWDRYEEIKGIKI